jgi:hypothetical protein
MLNCRRSRPGFAARFASTHLAVNIPNEDAIRQEQIKLVINHVYERPDHECVIIFEEHLGIASTGPMTSTWTARSLPSNETRPPRQRDARHVYWEEARGGMLSVRRLGVST